MLRQGVQVRHMSDLPTARARCADALDSLPPEHRSLVGSASYPVHIDPAMQDQRQRLLARSQETPS